MANFLRSPISNFGADFPNREVVEPMMEISTVPSPDHKFPRNSNFSATAGGGTFPLRSQVMGLLRQQQGFYCTWMRKRKVGISSHEEEHDLHYGARVGSRDEYMTRLDRVLLLA